MNKKKIWVVAFVFGLIATVIFYSKAIKGPTTASNTVVVTDAADKPAGEKKDNPKEAEKKEEPKQEVDQNKQAPQAPAVKEKDLEIEAGKRAISIAVDKVQGVSNFLKRGDFVDISLVYPPVEQHATSFVVLLYENVKVLAVGGKGDLSTEVAVNAAYDTVTLELAAIDGAKLSLAGQKGKIVLMLRAKDDSSISPKKHLDESELH